MTPKELAEKVDADLEKLFSIGEDGKVKPKAGLTTAQFNKLSAALDKASSSPAISTYEVTLDQIEEAMAIAYDEWNFGDGELRDLQTHNWLKEFSETVRLYRRQKKDLDDDSSNEIHTNRGSYELIHEYLNKKNNDKEQEQTRDNQ